MIGIMGGTFNPIHYGHLLICEHIREEFGLEKILFVPAKSPPHKDAEGIIGTEYRMEMVRRAISSNPWFEFSDVEMRLEGPSYTVKTLEVLSEKFGERDNLGLIIGADSMVQFTTWKRYEEILRMASLIVAPRPDTDRRLLDSAIEKLKKDFDARIYLSRTNAYDFSSTEIRNRVKAGLSIKYMVPESVECYILQQGLYAGK